MLNILLCVYDKHTFLCVSEKEKDYHVYYPENSLIASNRHSIQTNLSQERKHIGSCTSSQRGQGWWVDLRDKGMGH